MPTPACPSQEQLRAFVEGRTSGQAAETIADHLDQCAACEATVSSMEQVADPFVAGMRRPIGAEVLVAEPAYRQAVAAAQAISGPAASESGSIDEVIALGPFRPWDLGQYRVVAKLGEGGMGAVYKAVHTRLEKVVAIKVLPADRMKDQRAVARFEREMKAVGKLEHPNLVRAFDAGQAEDTHFLVMEYVEGINLDELVRCLGPLPVADACEVVRQAAIGLHYAHEHGLVHRDVKPSNLMLAVTATGCCVKVLDLGLALLTADERAEGELTAAGQAMGTADYMAPEQAFDSHRVDHRADLYGLGCTLYKLLSGRAPFSLLKNRCSMTILLAHLQQPVPAITTHRSDIPEPLAALLDRLLAKSAGERPSTAAEVAAALAPLAAASDLPALIVAARSPDRGSTVTGKSAATDSIRSSALAGTHGDAAIAAPVDANIGDGQGAGAPEADDQEATASAGGSDAAECEAPLIDGDRADRPAPRPVSRRSTARRLAAGLAMFAAAAAVVLGITIRIKNRGQPDTVIEAPSGSPVIIEEDGKVVARFPAEHTAAASGKPAPASAAKSSAGPRKTSPVPIQLEPEPLTLQPGAPVSNMALVQQPATIPGVRSWTIETVDHRGGWTQVAYSPDGRYFATCCRIDWTFVGTATGKGNPLKAHPASGGSDVAIRLWDATKGKLIRAIIAHDRPLGGICWSPDGRIITSSSCDRTVRFWDPETGRRLLTLHGEQGFGPLAWSPDGRRLAACGERRGVQVWQFYGGKEDGERPAARRPEGWHPVAPGIAIRTFGESSASMFRTLLWCNDSNRLVTTREGSSPLICDLNSGQELDIGYRVPYFGAGMSLSPDGSKAVFSGTPISLVDTETFETLRQFENDALVGSCIAWSPDGKSVAAGDWNPASPCVFDAATGKVARRTTGPVQISSLAYSPSGNALAAGTWAGRVAVWEGDKTEPSFVLPAHRTPAASIGFSHDGKALFYRPSFNIAVTQYDHLPLQVLDTGSGRILGEMSSGGSWFAAWSPDDTSLGFVQNAIVWRWKSGEATHLPGGYPGSPFMLTWRPDGKRYLVPKHDGHGRPDDALMIDVGGPTLQVVGTVPLKARTAAYSPDGKSLALAVDREVKLWDPEGEKLRESLPSAGAGLLLLSWSPDGKTLATAGEDNKVYLFDVEAKRILAVCEGHTDMVFSLGWSDGSKTLLSGSPDETRVWDARSGKLLRTIADDGGAFSADGRLVASRGDSAVRIRQTDDGRLLRTILSLRDKQYAAISPDGHFRGSPDVEKEFVYVVQTDDGQETLTPAEFSKRFQWTNDSEKVQISPPASAPKPRAQEK